MRDKNITDGISKLVFFFSIIVTLVVVVYLYGVFSHKHNLFPYEQLRKVYTNLNELLHGDDILSDKVTYNNKAIEILLPDSLNPGLLLITGALEGSRDTFVRVIDRNGTIIHEWNPKWNEIWGEKEGFFPRKNRPKTGMYLHGIDILPNGSFVANFEHLSTFLMNICGDVEWKHDNLGHHSVFYSDQNYLWVTAERHIAKGETGYQNHIAPLRSWNIQKFSVEGKLLQEIEIIDILRKNNLDGLLFLSTLGSSDTKVSGDTLHLNDVEEFPVGMQSSIFEPGDIMVSLRNINAIFVFDPESLKIKFLSIGHTLRHHDPDFLPGDKISIFDNHNLAPSTGPEPLESRIVEINASDGTAKVILRGEGKHRFFSTIMGVHQRLNNGNILLVSSDEGRVMEFTPEGNLAWHYDNRMDNRRNARVYNAILLPEHMDALFFENARNFCKQ